MTSLRNTYTYKKSLKITAYAASVIVITAVSNRVTVSIKGDPDFATILICVLFLIVPFAAITTVNIRYVLTNESLAKKFPLGAKIMKWVDVIEMVEKEGFFQRVLSLVDKNGRRINVPFEQLDGGKELYAQVKEIVPKTRN